VGVFEHLSCHRHVALSSQVNEAIAQVFAPDEKEYDQHDDDADRAQRLKKCAEYPAKDLQRTGWRGKIADKEGQFDGPFWLGGLLCRQGTLINGRRLFR
jgi:hypothetical protein